MILAWYRSVSRLPSTSSGPSSLHTAHQRPPVATIAPDRTVTEEDSSLPPAYQPAAARFPTRSARPCAKERYSTYVPVASAATASTCPVYGLRCLVHRPPRRSTNQRRPPQAPVPPLNETNPCVVASGAATASASTVVKRQPGCTTSSIGPNLGTAATGAAGEIVSSPPTTAASSVRRILVMVCPSRRAPVPCRRRAHPLGALRSSRHPPQPVHPQQH